MAKKEFCSITITITDYGNGDEPIIEWVGYIANKGLTEKHPNLKGIIKEFRNKNIIKKGEDVKI